MSIFSDTMTKAISDYRYLLRRHLEQVDRLTKLQELGLRDPNLYKSDLALYKMGHAIMTDIEENRAAKRLGYYTYSGMDQFGKYLKEYLSNYEVEGGTVVHRAQKASRALIQSIQLTTLPKERLTDKIAHQLFEYNKMVVELGAPEQWDLQLHTLQRQQTQNAGFYTRIISHLQSMIAGKMGERTVA